MKILHTESSEGWGGQEMRVVAEMQGLRERRRLPAMAGGGVVQIPGGGRRRHRRSVADAAQSP